ncbi:MAG: hypothetical protein LBL46_03520 [Rickettsiales bacterium]|jgi:hypothetical protein|nr:hypothetical protein [Rickettsiales bacterium]
MKNQISNEQRAMSNSDARQRNSKLLLLIAHCALLITLAPSAQAAKMCVRGFGAYGKVAKNAADGSFVSGPDCCPGGGGPNGYCDTTATYSGTGAPSGFCATPQFAGLATKSDQNIVVYRDRVVRDAASTGTNCWCKIAWPVETPWILIGANVWGSGLENCVAACAHHFGSFAITATNGYSLQRLAFVGAGI